MNRGQRSQAIRETLCAWYRRHARDLPWRKSDDPYAVWVSEIMLQQTRVATVKRYFGRFLKRFPDVRVLARAPLDAVLKAWEGLGYYGRARNLHRAAKVIVEKSGGALPRTAGELRELPGIGRTTAGAVASIAFGLDEPVLDGNVTRVLCRTFRIRTQPKETATERNLWGLARRLIPPGRAGEFNQALMDLGATVCTPRGPKCPVCPLNGLCLARAKGEEERLPVRAARRAIPHRDVAVAVIWRRGRVLIDRRKPQGLLGGLWEFPGGKCGDDETPEACVVRETREELGIRVKVRRPLVTVRHAYTHFRVTLHAFECDCISGRPQSVASDALRWVRPRDLDRFAFPAASLKIIDALRNRTRSPLAVFSIQRTMRRVESSGLSLPSPPARPGERVRVRGPVSRKRSLTPALSRGEREQRHANEDGFSSRYNAGSHDPERHVVTFTEAAMRSKRRRPVLAINGGPKTIRSMPEKVLRWPDMGKEEIAAASRLIRSGELSFSEDAEILVKEFRKVAGVRYAVACNNGTAAGHCCFFAIGIRPGDEIICPSFTFWASILQALHLGGVPVFAEMDPKTLNIDPDDIEHRITRRTKAIVVVHMLGVPCEMTSIMRIARRHGLKVIEDCAHAHGAAYRGRPVGSFGDVSFFSFQTSKLMPGGEGGIFCTNSREYYHRALAFGHYVRNQREKSDWSRFATGLGCKYRIHPIAAALGLCQLRKLKRHDRTSRRNVEHFHRGLRKLRCWDIPVLPKHLHRVYYQDWQPWKPQAAPGVSKERFIEALRAEGCTVRDARYNLLHQQTIFTDAKVYSKDGVFPVFADLPNKPVYRGDELPVSEAHRQKLIWLPTFPGGTTRHVDLYLEAFRKVEENLDELRG